MTIDLRSDTVTKPTKEMLAYMANAQVGDDVFFEDEQTNRLEQRIAKMFNMDAALFVPSGTMSNQIAIKMHTQPLDEIICESQSHVYNYETGGFAYHSGVSIKLIEGKRGIFNATDVIQSIQPDYDWLPVSKLLCLENTCNKGGGAVWGLDQMKEVSRNAREFGLKVHLDGARIFNALTHLGLNSKDIPKLFDTISICFSKGLGAPVGSTLLGSKSLIKRARRVRKVMGGGMRQVGYLSAACDYALDNHIDRLQDDHRRAKVLEETLKSVPFIEEILPVETNIVIFKLDQKHYSSNLVDQLAEKGLRCAPFGQKSVRFVTHLDFGDDQLEQAVKIIKDLI